MIPLSASSGSLALEMFEVHMFKTKKYHTPELIIMDVLLPSEESFELAKKLSKADNTKEIPVLFIVSSADIGNKKRIYQEGGKDYIEKPFVEEEVLTRIDSHLRYKALKDELTLKNTLLADNEKLLKRRSREIKGLHELATLLRGEESVDGIIQDIAKRIIPEHLQYPDRVFCEIEIDKKTYSNFTNVYSTNNFSFIAPVKINGVERGHLKVGYERGDETYLSVYEKRMIEIYAHEVALFLQNHELSGREKWMKETVEMTLEAYQDGILLVSKEGNIFRYNRKFLEIWGINEEVMKKEGPKKMMSVMKSKLENPVVYDDIFKTFMADEKGFTLELVFKTGKVFEVKGDFLPYSREERAYVWNFKEMTSYIQLKDECDKSKERIAQMENMLRTKMN